MENTERTENIKQNIDIQRETAEARREGYNRLAKRESRLHSAEELHRGGRTSPGAPRGSEAACHTQYKGAGHVALQGSVAQRNASEGYSTGTANTASIRPSRGNVAYGGQRTSAAQNIKKSKRRRNPFGRFLLMYSTVFVVITAVILTVFWNFISAYENSRHEHIIKEFMLGITEEQVTDLLGDAPLCRYESVSLITEYIRSRSEDPSFRCMKAADEYTDESPVYTVAYQGSTFATVTLSGSEKSAGFGFDMYEVSSMTVGIGDGERTTVTVTVPKGSVLEINGSSETSDFVKEDIAYPRASVWESDSSLLPLMTVYEIPGFVLLPEIKAESGETLQASVYELEGEIEVFFDLPESRKHSLQLTVPSEAVVSLGGIPLTDEQLTERGIAYESYADTPFNRAAGEFPTYCRYTVNGLVSEPDCIVRLGDWKLTSTAHTSDSGVVCRTYSQTAESSYRAEVHAPFSVKIFVNGIELDGTYLKENGAIYDEISELTKYIRDPISEQVYLVDMLYREPTVEIESADGVRSALTGEDGIYRFSNPTDESVKAEHADMVKDVITKYVEYTAAGYTDTDRSRFLAVRDCTWENSLAYNSITDTRHSFAQNIPCTIRSLKVESYDYRIWGENCFSCTVDFTAELTNFKNVTDRVEGMTLYFAEDDSGEWKLIKLLFS